jgi:hypothetical protein
MSVFAEFRSLPYVSGETTFDYGSIGRGFKSLRAHTENADQRHYLWSLPHENPTDAHKNPANSLLELCQGDQTPRLDGRCGVAFAKIRQARIVLGRGSGLPVNAG